MEVIWSTRARNSYFGIMDYLQENWTKKEMIQFSNKTIIVIKAITKNPCMFVSSGKHPNIRKATIDKNNSLFYQVDKKYNKIYLLTFFDNQQDLKKLNLY